MPELSSPAKEDTLVPCVRVSSVQSLKLSPNQSAVVPVKAEGQFYPQGYAMLVEGYSQLEKDTGLIVEEAVLPPLEDGRTHLVVTNLSGITQTISPDAALGLAQAVDVMSSEDEPCIAVDICGVSSSGDEWRIRNLLEKLRFEDVLPAEMSELQKFLAWNHAVFSLEMVSMGRQT